MDSFLGTLTSGRSSLISLLNCLSRSLFRARVYPDSLFIGSLSLLRGVSMEFVGWPLGIMLGAVHTERPVADMNGTPAAEVFENHSGRCRGSLG